MKAREFTRVAEEERSEEGQAVVLQVTSRSSSAIGRGHFNKWRNWRGEARDSP
ncbi:MAG: hypothetical protein LM600_07870 [Thaumarchaeota archaeon]|nr:hypothetical protein [Nitrososphaerota archaeon]